LLNLFSVVTHGWRGHTVNGCDFVIAVSSFDQRNDSGSRLRGMSIREQLLNGLLCAAESAGDLAKRLAVGSKLPSQGDINLASHPTTLLERP
jgi:hypothetical protein